MKIPVIVPCADYHMQFLEDCIAGIRKNVLDDISTVYIISPREQVESVKSLHIDDVTVLDENEVFKIDKQDLFGNRFNPWIYQQLIKLTCGDLSESGKYITIDADHYLIKPHRFLEGNCTNYFVNRMFDLRFKGCTDALLGTDIPMNISYITEEMMFDVFMLNEMRCRIESKTGKDWLNAIVDSGREGTFSEFMTYGSFVTESYPEISNMKYSSVWRLQCIPDGNEHFLSRMAANYPECDSLTLFTPKIAIPAPHQ